MRWDSRTVARARAAVQAAVARGDLKRPERCSCCGRGGFMGDPIQAHHENYDRPLDVVWLCRSCHMRRHHALGWGRSGVHGSPRPRLTTEARRVRAAIAIWKRSGGRSACTLAYAADVCPFALSRWANARRRPSHGDIAAIEAAVAGSSSPRRAA